MNAGTFTTGDGCTIAYALSGRESAPVLILSNSLGTSMTMWEPQLAALDEHFRVLRYDMRGHGRSDAPPGAYSLDRLGRDVIELADFVGVAAFSFCGLSLGGMIGQWLGWRAPERLQQLVIANSSAFMGPASAWDERIRTVLNDGMAAMAGPVLARWFTPSFAADPANTRAILHGLERSSAQGYAGCCAAVRDMDMRRVLSLIDTPCLIIGGNQDPATPPSHTRELHVGIAGSRCVMLDAAHLSNIEQPQPFTNAVLAFLLEERPIADGAERPSS